MKTLVLGCDASGKSSFLSGVSNKFDIQAIEATSSPEAKAFKLDTLDTPIYERLIEQRENTYLRLSEFAISSEARGCDIITTSSTLVTRISHNVMRSVIGLTSLPNKTIINKWIDKEEIFSLPDALVLVHAPIDVIVSRISNRQKSGNKSEKFWGFNSIMFLSQYQECLKDIAELIPGFLAIPTLTIDTSRVSPNESIDKFSDIFTTKLSPEGQVYL